MIDDIEARLHSALDELSEAVELRHPAGPRVTTTASSSINFASDISNSSGTDDIGTSGDRRNSSRADPKLLVLAACVVLLLVALGLAGLSHVHRHHSSKTVSTSTSIPSPATTLPATTLPPTTLPPTTLPPTPTTAVPEVPPATISLPISVESDSAMQAAGNNGPSSSILMPSSCVLSGDTVTATGTYQGGFAPNVYNRYGDVVVLYVFGAPSSGYPQGAQLGASPASNSPVIGSGTWRVSTAVDLPTGQPVSCVVAAQPTHEVQLAP